MAGRIATLAAALTLAAGTMLGSGGLDAQEAVPRAFGLVFRTGTLDGVPEGTELRHEGAQASGDIAGEGWRSVVVGLAPGGRAVVEGVEDEAAPQVIGSFDAGLGNPVAMAFLESTVTDVAEATGGSPSYIRNRIRDALSGTGQVSDATAAWGGSEVPASEVVLLPFASDARRAELGAFAGLEMRVVVSEEVPGWHRLISPEVPEASPYAASLSLAEARE